MTATRTLTKRVCSGKYINLAEIQESDIEITDISKALNYIYRFTGHHKDAPPLNVAQHTALTVHICQYIFPDDNETALDCLIHDFAEAYTGDIATPLKSIFGPQFYAYEQRIEDMIYNKYYVPVIGTTISQATYEKRKICDLLALDIERRSLWNDVRGKNKWPNISMESIFSSKDKKALYTTFASIEHVDLARQYADMVKHIKETQNDVNV